MPSQVDALVLSKSLALVEKTKRRISQIDSAAFPTDSSEVPRALLVSALERLSDKSFWRVMDPEAFYHALIELQKLVDEVEASTVKHISWPLVSYCDHFWKRLFPSGKAQIFYSVFTEHNYGIRSFTQQLSMILEKILPPTEIDKIINGRQVYCLQIASIEDENLPLYANIGHEFGHVLYRDNEAKILDLLFTECDVVMKEIAKELATQGGTVASRRAKRVALILIKTATELFADVVGAMISGPAFLLSLHEMGWGVDPCAWRTRLSLRDSDICSYPSFAFRLSVLKQFLPLKELNDVLSRNLAALPPEKNTLKNFSTWEVDDNFTGDRVEIHPKDDSDAVALQAILNSKLTRLQECLIRFITKCEETILTPLKKQHGFSILPGEDLFKLIQRLDQDILPNIIIASNKDLLGTPASFETILNASALYRKNKLAVRDEETGSEEINHQIQKVERLTAKAFEVSYIQNDFNSWKKKKNV